MTIPSVRLAVTPEVNLVRHRAAGFEPAVHRAISAREIVYMLEYRLRVDQVERMVTDLQRVAPWSPVDDPRLLPVRRLDRGTDLLDPPRSERRAEPRRPEQRVRKLIGFQFREQERKLSIAGQRLAVSEQAHQLLEYR